MASHKRSSKIEKINFGEDAAEDDFQLNEYFYSYLTYRNFVDKGKTILVGNRGSGKSAIFKHIKSKELRKGNFVLELTPEEYSYEILSNLMQKEQDGNWEKQSGYSIAWQYLIYHLIFEELVKSYKGKLIRGSASKIYAYVRDNFQSKNVNPIGVLISYLKRLEEIKLGPIEGHRKVEKLKSLYELDEIKDLIPDLVKSLRHKKFFVLVDELDKGWDNSEDCKYFVSGLFQAVEKINRVSPNLQVLISIRQELYDNIPQISDNAQKIRSKIELIRWTKEDLLELIGLRLSHCIHGLDQLTAEQKWNKIFTPRLQDADQNHKSFDYLLGRTLLRPREVIQYCRLCLDLSYGEKKISQATIKKADFIHSEQKIRDLAAEYRFQYPGLLDLLEAFRGKGPLLTRDSIEEIILSLMVGDISPGEATWIVD